MPPKIYKHTVFVAALIWTIFGMFLGKVLGDVDAGTSVDRSDVFFLVLWLAMGIADAWTLLRYGGFRPPASADHRAPVT